MMIAYKWLSLYNREIEIIQVEDRSRETVPKEQDKKSQT